MKASSYWAVLFCAVSMKVCVDGVVRITGAACRAWCCGGCVLRSLCWAVALQPGLCHTDGEAAESVDFVLRFVTGLCEVHWW